jgi:hypothetical protein
MRIGGFCVAFAVVAAVAVGCGGGKSDEDQVSDVIEQTATTSSKENCTELETQRFVEQNTFETGKAAVKSCIDDTGSSNADSVEISDVKIDGDKATATVAVTGSAFGGQTLKVSLVKADDQWKMDHIDDFVNFDQQKFAKAFEAALTEGENSLPADQAKCIASGFANASADAAKTVILSGQSAALEPVFQKCGVGG